MKPTCSIIIPTYNNPEYLIPCIESIRLSGALMGLCELIIVNNGTQPIKEYVKGWVNTTVLEPGRNLGWEGGLAYGIKEAKGDFFCFQNDDTVIPKATQSFYSQLLWPFNDKNVAAVGPATTIASGWHSIFNVNAFRILCEVSYLIFFTVMIRREDYESVGGIDTSAPGGDDIDLSIRLRKFGKKILVNPDAFIIHHAFKTGTRVRGDHTVSGGWNSKEMTDKTNKWLIQKHGFKSWLETMRGLDLRFLPGTDLEGEMVASLVRGGTIVELGCGARKTVPQAVGIDLIPKGDPCGNIEGVSVADITANVTEPLPLAERSVDTIIARHILEHVRNPCKVLSQWKRVLKDGGRIIIAVPNQEIRNTIPLNPEHCNSYTPDCLSDMMHLLGWKEISILDPKNGISFVGVFEKVMSEVEGELVNA